VPYGTSCADSRLDPLRDTRDLELATVIAFATHGFPVIMPDYAGFIAGSPVAGYLLSEDEAHSLLDATRAVQQLLPAAPDKIVLVGHSQGGHAVLSAQALARSYGLSGELVGVAAFAPFWAVGRAMGAIVSAEFGFNTHDDPGLLSFAIEYFYTHAELYDGTGRGAALFKPAVRNALKSFVSTCQFEADPSVLGASSADFLQPDFLAAVGECGVFGGADCASGLAATWERRFRADRPKLDPRGAPVVMWQGALDAVIPTSLAKCAIDKLGADLPAGNTPATFTLCGDAAADHESLESNNAAWVTSWIEARARRGAEPPSCPGESALELDGVPLSCMTPPGNDD
jgi:pimeloyl-ACP methyl ester carboxylesterase